MYFKTNPHKRKKLLLEYLLTLIAIILILNMPFMLLLNTFRFAAFDFNWYQHEFAKVGSYEASYESGGSFGGSKEVIDNTAKYLLDYLKYDATNNPPKIEIYGNEENVHLLEVKGIMQKALLFADLTLFVFIVGNLMILLLIFLRNDMVYELKQKYLKYLSKILVYGGMLTIGLIGFVALSLELNFNFTFAVFHKLLSFGQWQFPYTSSMIKMFPGEFFYDIGGRIFLMAIVSAVFLIVVSYVVDKKLKH